MFYQKIKKYIQLDLTAFPKTGINHSFKLIKTTKPPTVFITQLYFFISSPLMSYNYHVLKS